MNVKKKIRCLNFFFEMNIGKKDCENEHNIIKNQIDFILKNDETYE